MSDYNYRKVNNNSYGNNSRYGNNNDESPEQVLRDSNYNGAWIKEGANQQLPDFAEKMGKYMANNGLTNSKIRSIYGEIKRIQMGNFEKEKASFFLLRPKVAYALGRDPRNKGLQLFKLIFDQSSKDVSDQRTYLNFCNLLEAILAYHKANGGKD
jgi:CRISPR-associated protein Csm2